MEQVIKSAHGRPVVEAVERMHSADLRLTDLHARSCATKGVSGPAGVGDARFFADSKLPLAMQTGALGTELVVLGVNGFQAAKALNKPLLKIG